MIAPREHALTRSEVFREFVAVCIGLMDGDAPGIDWAALEREAVFSLAAAQCDNSCAYGHEWTVENTRIGPDGRRRCRQCASDRRARKGA